MDVYKEWLGIPEDSRPPNNYELLRVPLFEDETERIKKNYKKLNGHVRKYATGQYSTQSQDLLNELARAMLCLTDAERKREYDESLGREFDDGDEGLTRKPLGRVLIDRGIMTRDQLQEAEHFAEARGLSMRDAVVQMEITDEATAAEALSTELGLSFVDLSDTDPDDDALDRVPRAFVKRNTMLPLFIDQGRILVATTDLIEPNVEDELRLRYGVPPRGVIAVPRQIRQQIAKHYAPGVRDESKLDDTPVASSASKSTRKTSGAKKPKEKLSEEEYTKQRNIGLIIMAQSIVIPTVLQLLGYIPESTTSKFLGGHSFITVLMPAVVIPWAYFSYVKK